MLARARATAATGQSRAYTSATRLAGGSDHGTAIRKHLRDFIAVAVLLVVAAGDDLYILQKQRLRIPVLEEKPFELKAEFETAQAVVPGQGQTLRVAGVRVGDVEDVELEDGHGVVTFDVDREFLPIYQDATILMRPTTGLKDMFFELDPGTREGRRGTRRATRCRSPTRRPTSTSTRSSRRSTPTRRRTCGCCSSARARASRAAVSDLGQAARQPGPDQPRPRRSLNRGRDAHGRTSRG